MTYDDPYFERPGRGKGLKAVTPAHLFDQPYGGFVLHLDGDTVEIAWHSANGSEQGVVVATFAASALRDAAGRRFPKVKP
jgi:hypothetical protein